MKTAILMFLTAAASEAAAATGAAAVAKVIELTSPELVKLNADLKTAWAKQRSIEDMDSTEFSEAATETMTIKGAIAKEKSRLVKEQNDQKLAELRKGVIADFDALLDLRDVANTKGATDEQKAAWDNAREQHINVLLGTVPKPKVDGAEGAAKWGTKTEKIIAMATAGNTYGQMIASGLGGGTIRTALTKSTGWKKVGTGDDATYAKI